MTTDWKGYFGRCYVVNLDRREDRYQAFLSRLPADWPLAPVERFAAIDGRKCPLPAWWRGGKGAWGCYRSHLGLIERCLNEGVESVLLMEDDAVFCDDFSSRVGEFLAAVPSDWGMIYLGGQHLRQGKSRPQKVNDLVYRPFNVNRTHAFALRGQTMRRRLSLSAWGRVAACPPHRSPVGAFHETGRHAIYCPAEWLVGQAAGRSDVSGRAPPDRFWKASADLVEKEPTQQPFVAIVGLHSSGSSCLAGVLYHLGLHLGNKLVGYYGTDPDKNCGFEAQGLMQICERAIPFPATSVVQSPEALDRAMRRWIMARQAEAAKTDRFAAGKYPMLCRLGDSLRRVCGDGLLVIDCDRPLEESVASLIRREPRRDPKASAAHQEWLLSGKSDLLAFDPARTADHRCLRRSIARSGRRDRQVDRVPEDLPHGGAGAEGVCLRETGDETRHAGGRRMKDVPVWSYWDSGQPPPIIQLCIELIGRWHPRFTLVTAESLAAMGGGEVLGLTADHALAHRADLARFWLLKTFGGLWLDADCIALRPADLPSRLEGDATMACPRRRKCHSHAIAAVGGSPLAEEAFRRCRDFLATNPRDTFLWAAPSDGVLDGLLSDWSGLGYLRPVVHWPYRFLNCTAMPKERLLGERRPDAHYRQQHRRWGPNACVYHILCAALSGRGEVQPGGTAKQRELSGVSAPAGVGLLKTPQ